MTMKRTRLLLTALAWMVATANPATAFCISRAEVTDAGSASYRYVWFLVESSSHARIAWQEADDAADSPHPVTNFPN